MRSIAVLVVCGVVGGATAAFADIVEPKVPRDPQGIREANQWLDVYWRACRVELYPQDPEAGVDKWAGTVRFRRAGKKMRGELSLSPHKLDGTAQKATLLQKRLIACVERRFEARRFWPLDSWRGDTWAIRPNDGMEPVLQGTELGAAMAMWYVLGQLAPAKAACKAKRARLDVTIDVAIDGSVTAVAMTGATPKEAACIETQLTRRLRFPTISKPTQVRANE
jgi:hypothetical protein